MSEPSDDFAKMFEASIQAKRIDKGQTVEGTIVAIGPEVALVDVGGKSEATIDVGELKDDEGDLDVAVGDRIQAMGAGFAARIRDGMVPCLGPVAERGSDRSPTNSAERSIRAKTEVVGLLMHARPVPLKPLERQSQVSGTRSARQEQSVCGRARAGPVGVAP